MAIVMAMTHDVAVDAVGAARHAHRAAAEKERWRRFIESVGLAVLGIDNEARIDYVNPFLQKLSGYTDVELLGQPLQTIIAPAEHGESPVRFGEAVADGPRPSSRWAVRCASGEDREIAWSTVRIADEDGQATGFLAIGADVTEQHRARAALLELQHDIAHFTRVGLLGELVSALAHELNQPLAAILSNAQAARRFMDAGTPDLPEVRAILDDIVRDDKRAGDVIHGLREMLRKEVPERERLSIDSAVHEALGLLHSELVGADVTVKTELAPGLPPVGAGKVEIQQVVMNLAMNAVHAMRSVPRHERELTIRTSSHQEFVVVTVRDTGPGVPEDALPHVFDSFFTTKASGLGMELSICRRMIRRHGGDVWCGNHEDGGAVFCFSLPAEGGQGTPAGGSAAIARPEFEEETS